MIDVEHYTYIIFLKDNQGNGNTRPKRVKKGSSTNAAPSGSGRIKNDMSDSSDGGVYYDYGAARNRPCFHRLGGYMQDSRNHIVVMFHPPAGIVNSPTPSVEEDGQILVFTYTIGADIDQISFLGDDMSAKDMIKDAKTTYLLNWYGTGHTPSTQRYEVLLPEKVITLPEYIVASRIGTACLVDLTVRSDTVVKEEYEKE